MPANDNQATRFAVGEAGEVVGLDLVALDPSELSPEALAALMTPIGAPAVRLVSDDRDPPLPP